MKREDGGGECWTCAQSRNTVKVSWNTSFSSLLIFFFFFFQRVLTRTEIVEPVDEMLFSVAGN